MKTRRFRTSIVILVLLCVVIAFTAWRNLDVQVVVSDPTGSPIPRASVVGASLSMNATPQNTDATGTANVRRYIGLQAIKWIKVTAPGYESVEVPVSENGPLRVTLQRRAE